MYIHTAFGISILLFITLYYILRRAVYSIINSRLYSMRLLCRLVVFIKIK